MTAQKYTAKREQKKKNVNFCNFTVFTPKIHDFVVLTHPIYNGQKNKQSNNQTNTFQHPDERKFKNIIYLLSFIDNYNYIYIIFLPFAVPSFLNV